MNAGHGARAGSFARSPRDSRDSIERPVRRHSAVQAASVAHMALRRG